MLAGSWGHGMSRKSLFSPVIAHPATMKFAWEARAENNKSIGAVQTWHWFQVAPLTQAYVPPPNVKPTPTWSKWLWHVVAPVSTATSSMSTWFGGITWLSWPLWMRKQPSGGETAALKSVGTTVLRSSGSKYGQIPMERTLWRFPIPQFTDRRFHLAIDPLQKNAIEQLQTSQDFCDGNWPRTNPYHSSFAVQLWVSISAWTPNVMTCHDHLQKNTGMPRPMEVCCFSIYCCPVFFPQSIAFKVFLSQAGRHTALRREFLPLSLGSTNRKINENRNHRSARLSSAPEK